MTSATGLFSLNIAYIMDEQDYPDYIKLYIEPEVIFGGSARQLDYAIVDQRDPVNVLVLAEVKRIITTHNLSDYVHNSFKVFNEILKESQNYFSDNRFLVLHIHLAPWFSGETELYEVLKALDAVSIFANVSVIVSRGEDIDRFEEDLAPFLEQIIHS
ncbi:hypothetical protein [Staphylothermus hellenicus]|uniref:Uncharacterized protein n=1 Tax=Staphylothermus hellenicus (strain DSM 12710 / JCM 10830 / BK20S6-10-b1 / P8) TaxID=591019 RepID=D7DB03_STAHD|nr:hypothetical protein [Staphylothermus hellenicus]ADI31350.1 hypothetical protein Shell_0209 [Staphylothermus hellenicus DSM 12710]